MHIGYARVSTGEQNLDLQTDALEEEGCDRVYTDELSGATAERPGLGTLQLAEVALGERRGSHAVHSCSQHRVVHRTGGTKESSCFATALPHAFSKNRLDLIYLALCQFGKLLRAGSL